jgi:hypothetical protein
VFSVYGGQIDAQNLARGLGSNMMKNQVAIMAETW